MDTIKKIGRTWNSISLIKRIIVGLVIGTILALAIPGNEIIEMLGTLFVNALKSVAPILVFFLVISALCNAKGGGQMKLVIILYLVGTFIAGAVAVLASTLFPVDLTLSAAAEAQSSPSGIGEVLATLVTNVVANPVTALMSANYLGILAWAVVLGIALRRASDQVKDVFTSISDAVSTVVRWIISLAPFGILGLIYTAVSTNGLEIFTEYGQLLLALVGCMLFIAFVTNPILSFACFRKNPYGLVLRCLKDSGLTAFFTRSSAANIPVNMELCRKLGLDKDNYSLSIPLGATINMGGAAVTISVMAMMAAHTMGIQVDIPTAIILRRIGRRWRLAAPDPARLLAVRHRQRHRDAGRRHRLRDRRHPGLLRDRAQFLFRRALRRIRRVQPVEKGRPRLQTWKGHRSRVELYRKDNRASPESAPSRALSFFLHLLRQFLS